MCRTPKEEVGCLRKVLTVSTDRHLRYFARLPPLELSTGCWTTAAAFRSTTTLAVVFCTVCTSVDSRSSSGFFIRPRGATLWIRTLGVSHTRPSTSSYPSPFQPAPRSRRVVGHGSRPTRLCRRAHPRWALRTRAQKQRLEPQRYSSSVDPARDSSRLAILKHDGNELNTTAKNRVCAR